MEVAKLVSIPTRKWRIAAASVRGAMHMRDGKENQDAFGWVPESGVGTTLVGAVADGHGNKKSIRSARGSRIAVDVAKRVLGAYSENNEPLGSLSALKQAAEERLPQALARGWRKAVAADLASDPLSAAELDALEERQGLAARTSVMENPYIAYGSTLLAVLIATEFVLYTQAGDGDIITVSASGEASRPLPSDARLFANETTSLSAAEAWRDFRVRFQPLNGAPPAMIFLSTDGYANSFQSDEGFLAVGPDILERARAEGMVSVQEKLTEWLTAATQNGSGDDVTLAVIKRMEERDADSVLARLSACELQAEENADCIGRLVLLEESCAQSSRKLEDMEDQLGLIKRLLRVQRRFLLAAVALAIVALVLSLAILCRSTAKPEMARAVEDTEATEIAGQQQSELQPPAGRRP